jgi:hypothetical protein
MRHQWQAQQTAVSGRERDGRNCSTRMRTLQGGEPVHGRAYGATTNKRGGERMVGGGVRVLTTAIGRESRGEEAWTEGGGDKNDHGKRLGEDRARVFFFIFLE